MASRNKVKIVSVNRVFKTVFSKTGVRVVSVDPPSSIPTQPIGLSETIKCSLARAMHAMGLYEGGDYYVGIESGVSKPGEITEDPYVVTVVSMIEGSSGKTSLGVGPAFKVPARVFSLIRSSSREMEEIAGRLYKVKNLGEGEGLAGFLSKGLLTRSELTEQAVKTALIPFLSPDEYWGGSSEE